MSSDAIQQLLDREAIRECLYTYCRGIDRQDEDALRASYWPDATDRHGPYQGSAAGFIDWALASLKKGERSVHMVANIAIRLKGEQAAVESYFLALQRSPNAEGQQAETFLAGRYVDLFEKRGDEWRVKERTVVYDWKDDWGVPDGREPERFGVRIPQGSAKPSDPYYALLTRLGA
jgi:ketosteroid isomerase-like protein